MLQLRYGTYFFPLAPKISVAKTPVTATPAPGGVRVTWTLTGELYYTNAQTPESIAAMRAAMEAALYGPPQDLVWQDSTTGAVIDALWQGVSTSGVVIESVKFAAGDGTEYATHLPFEVVAWAEYRVDLVSSSTPPAGILNVFGEYSVAYTQDHEVNALSISGTLQSYFWATIQAEIGKIKIAVDPQMLILSESTTISSRTPTAGGGTKLRASFRIEAIHGSATPEVIEVKETIAVEAGILEPIARPRFGGNPVVQTGPIRPTIISQDGSAVGLRMYPNFLDVAPLRYSLPLMSASRTKQSPERRSSGLGAGLMRFPISWSYRFLSDTPLAAPNDPANPSNSNFLLVLP